MPLSFNPSKPIPFYDLDPEPFQELCRDLFEREDGISTCEIFGVNGQHQRGIDLRAQRREGYGCEVGQCKCYEEFPPREIREVSEEFLKHLAYWKEKNVRRFILFVACPMSTVRQNEEIDRQVRAFHELGIDYQVWSARTLRTKLRDHPDIVVRYSRSREWVEAICGVASSSSGNIAVERTVSLIDSVVNSRLPIYSAELSRELDRRLDNLRELYRKGRKKDAYNQLGEIQASASWEIIEASLKGKLLRQKAAYLLDLSGDIAAARCLADEAAEADSEGDETVIRALLAYYAEGAHAALQIADSPSNINAYNLRVALLIEMERVPEALELLQAIPTEIQPDNETKRVRALALFLSGSIKNARSEIEQALEAEPERESFRFVAAVINYFSCLSPASLPNRLAPWPEPPNWFVLKRDRTSLDRLKHAEAEFAALARQAEKDDWRVVLETWQLACVGNDAYRQQEAQTLCRELLSQNPQHYRALIWALERNYEVNYSDCEQALRRFVEEEGSAHPVHRVEAVAVLLALCLEQNAATRAAELLTKCENLLVEIGARQSLGFWRGQVLIATGQLQEAEDAARKERNPELRRRLLLVALRARAESTGKWSDYLRYLEKNFKRTGESELLFELCSIKAEQNKWDFVAERAELLVEKSQTAAALRLAAISLWKEGKVSRCLALLNKGDLFFHDNLLPADLARLKVNCQSERGELSQAVAGGKELVRREGATENVLTLMQAQLRQADLKELAVTARTLLIPASSNLVGRGEVGPQTLIRAASWVSFEDEELAKDLWRQAAQLTDNQPALLAELVTTGHTLGLDKEIKPYFEQMIAHSRLGGGAVQLISLKQLIARQRKHEQKLVELQHDYEGGALPLHMLAAPLKRTMAEILHGFPEQHRKEVEPLRQARIFVRHGGRPLHDQVIKSSEQWRLHLDISALILGEDLGILDEVENTFKPLFISSETTSALIMQRHKLRRVQPSQVDQCAKLLRLLKENKAQRLEIEVEREPIADASLANVAKRKGPKWSVALSQARSEQAFLVDYFPLRSNEVSPKKIILPHQYRTYVIDCRAILNNLKTHGWIAEDKYIQALDALGNEKHSRSTVPNLTEGSKLYLMGNIAGVLADADILELTCNYYRVFIDAAYAKYAQGLIESRANAEQLGDWLDKLSRRLRNGLANGTYVCERLSDDHPLMKLRKADEPEVNIFTDLMFNEHQSGDVLWIDDRWCNAYWHSNSTPIVGINEVLEALRQRGVISEQDYFKHLLKLRAGNLRYIPVTTEEILYHLNKAAVEEEILVETPELRILKRYLAGCLLDEDTLQIPPRPQESPNPSGEMAFTFNAKTAVDIAIAQVWENNSASNEEVEARADWLLDNLYTGGFGVRHLLPNAEGRGDATFLAGLDLAGLFAFGCLMNLELSLGQQNDRFSHFINWFEERLLIPRLNADQEAVQIAGAAIANFITDAANQQYETRDHEKVARLWKSLLYAKLPEALKAEVKLEPQVMKWIGTKTLTAVTIGEFSFNHNAFASAIERVMSDETKVTIRAVEPNVKCTFNRTDAGLDGTPIVEVHSGKNKSKPAWRIKDDFLKLASPNAAEREAAIRGNRYWIDCETERFEQAIHEINNIHDATARLDKAQEWRRGSAEVYYRSLADKLGRTGTFQWAGLIPPSAEGMLRHYRLTREFENSDFAAAWQHTANTLFDEEGLETALDRLARLPVTIPEIVVERVRALPPEEKKAILTKCAARWASPVGRLHLADLALRICAQDDNIPAEAHSAIQALFNDDEGRANFELFEALLDFSYEKFSLWKDTESWAPSLRLAMVWAHAVQLHNIFHSVNGAPKELAEIFVSYNSQHGTTSFLHRRTAMWNDVLHPRRFSRSLFLTHGVAIVLGGHAKQYHETLKLRELVLSVSFTDHANTNLLPLLCDYTQAFNSTRSYLGGNHADGLSQVLGSEEAKQVSSERLSRMAAEAVQNLQADPSGWDWATLEVISMELPIYASISLQLNDLIEQTDFPALFEKNAARALPAWRIAIGQSYYCNDEKLRGRLEGDLLRCLAATCHKQSSDEALPVKAIGLPQDQRIGGLIDLAFRLSLREDDPRSTSRNFSRLVRAFLHTCPSVRGHFGPSMVRFLRQLPASSLHGMWQLGLAIRAY